MNTRFRHFFMTVLGYFLGNVFTKLISVILLPLYTKLIDPKVYGAFSVNATIVQLVVGIVYIAIWNSIFRFAAEEDSTEKKYEIISTGIPVMIVSSIVCIVVIAVINVFSNLSNPVLVSIYAIANALQYFYGYIARSMKDNRIFIISGCVNSLSNLILNVIGIAVLRQGVSILYYSYIMGCMAQILIIECKYRPLAHFRIWHFQIVRLRSMMTFGVPLALNSIMQWLLNGLTQIMIANMLGTYYNGLYSVANKFSTLISLLVSVFEYAWLELAYDIARGNNSKLAYKRTLNVLFVFILFGASAAILAIKIIFPYFVAETYRESLTIIPHIVGFASANAFASFIASIYMSYKAVSMLTVSSLVAGGVNFVLLLVMIPHFGLGGAVTALMLAAVLMMLIRLLGLRVKFALRIDTANLPYLLLFPISVMAFYSVDNVLALAAVIVGFGAVFLISLKRLYFTYIAAYIGTGN